MKEEFNKELRELSPLLAYLKKEQEGDAFKVPKFYFDNLANKVIAQAKEAENTHVVAKKQTPQYLTFIGRLQDFVSNLLSPRFALGFGSCLIVAFAAWFMLSSKKTGTPINDTTVSVTPSTNMGQSANVVEPTGSAVNPVVGDKTPIKGQKDATNPDNKLNTNSNGAILLPQNATKLGELAEQNTSTEDGQLVHPQSGLTEEELTTYLEENTDENDSDGSDNNL